MPQVDKEAVRRALEALEGAGAEVAALRAKYRV
jgi:hypothetical protein